MIQIRREANEPSPRREDLPGKITPEPNIEERAPEASLQDCIPGMYVPKLNYDQDHEDDMEDLIEAWELGRRPAPSGKAA
ncbi:MAG TPA: hypothetical protein VL688_05965 [Verrucomicrobiae bacterium]|nr:hypothetical protein [Verrucomicrobiae bacterium]